MKYKGFENLPEHLAEKYKNMIINSKPMYYEANPSFSEEELDDIVSDFIKLRNTLWHGLPNQIAKLVAEELEECLQPETWQENKVGELILYSYEEGVFNGKGEKLMSWGEFQKKHGGQKLVVNIKSNLKKMLISRGIAKE